MKTRTVVFVINGHSINVYDFEKPKHAHTFAVEAGKRTGNVFVIPSVSFYDGIEDVTPEPKPGADTGEGPTST